MNLVARQAGYLDKIATGGAIHGPNAAQPIFKFLEGDGFAVGRDHRIALALWRLSQLGGIPSCAGNGNDHGRGGVFAGSRHERYGSPSSSESDLFDNRSVQFCERAVLFHIFRVLDCRGDIRPALWAPPNKTAAHVFSID